MLISNTWLWSSVVVVLVLVGAAFVYRATWDEGCPVPPVSGDSRSVSQSAKATDQGATVEMGEAVFTEEEIFVCLNAELEDENRDALALRHTDVELKGVTGIATSAGSDWTIVEFPLIPELNAGGTEQLVVHALPVRTDGSRVERVEGRWAFELEIPDDLPSKNSVQPENLHPVEDVEVHGMPLEISGQRTGVSTIIRFHLPPGVYPTDQISLTAGGEPIDALEAGGSGDPDGEGLSMEARFNPTSPGEHVTFRLDGLTVADLGTGTEFSITLEPFDIPASIGRHPFDAWHSDDAIVKDVELNVFRHNPPRPAPDVRLRIIIEGLWEPRGGDSPKAVADGEPLAVLGVGWYPATSDRGDESSVAIQLPEGAPDEIVIPGEITVTIPGQPRQLPPVEVTLVPE